jgi:hypothetical protein
MKEETQIDSFMSIRVFMSLLLLCFVLFFDLVNARCAPFIYGLLSQTAVGKS